MVKHSPHLYRSTSFWLYALLVWISLKPCMGRGRLLCRSSGYPLDSLPCKLELTIRWLFLILTFLAAYLCKQGRNPSPNDMLSLREETKRRVLSSEQNNSSTCSSNETEPLSGIYQGDYIEVDGFRRRLKLRLRFKKANSDDEAGYVGYEISGHGEYENNNQSTVVEGFLNKNGQVYWIEEGPCFLSFQPTTREVITSGTWNFDNHTFAGAFTSTPVGRFYFTTHQETVPRSADRGASGAYTLSLVPGSGERLDTRPENTLNELATADYHLAV